MVLTDPAPRKLKRLFWDIEVTPNVVLAFRIGREVSLGHDSIINERKVICIGYKWQGEKKVHVLRWSADQDDKEMLRDFALVAAEADELVAHFGDRFDLKWFKTRILFHGLPPVPFYKTIDTKAWASNNFYFNSNKLDYISNYLGHGKKEEMEFQDWVDITLFNDLKKLNKMCHYCGVDVEKLEKVYLDFAPHVKPKSHAGVMACLDKWSCPRCSSLHITRSKKRVTAAGTIQHQMQCLDCGGYYGIGDPAYKNLLIERKRACCKEGGACGKGPADQGEGCACRTGRGIQKACGKHGKGIPKAEDRPRKGAARTGKRAG